MEVCAVLSATLVGQVIFRGKQVTWRVEKECDVEELTVDIAVLRYIQLVN